MRFLFHSVISLGAHFLLGFWLYEPSDRPAMESPTQISDLRVCFFSLELKIPKWRSVDVHVSWTGPGRASAYVLEPNLRPTEKLTVNSISPVSRVAGKALLSHPPAQLSLSSKCRKFPNPSFLIFPAYLSFVFGIV